MSKFPKVVDVSHQVKLMGWAGRFFGILKFSAKTGDGRPHFKANTPQYSTHMVTLEPQWISLQEYLSIFQETKS